ncbi:MULTISPECIES: exodeoxyribonuclease VII small subunit [Helicobacter]|nr:MULTISPECIES: exodeoxyribonuclease VII small subunit [Helicobacter]
MREEMQKNKQKAMKNQEMNFEDYLSIISKCLEKLEEEELTLNEGLAFYKEGMENLQKAQRILEDAQLQCEELKMQYKKENQ